MTLNGVMVVTLRYFTEVGKPALQKTICGGIYARVYCIFSACTMSSQRKLTFAISSPDEFVVMRKETMQIYGDSSSIFEEFSVSRCVKNQEQCDDCSHSKGGSIRVHWEASWCRGRASDSRSRGRMFGSRPGTTA